MDLYYNDND